ncbi:MAG: hypothetical protein PVG60_02085, partial [Desulfarculaceae bacterium]
MSLTSVPTNLKDAVDLVKNIKELMSKFSGAAEMVPRIDELYQSLIEALAQSAELVSENSRLKDELSELEKKQHLDDVLTMMNGKLYRTDKEGEEKGPYCTRCWQVDKRLISMNHTPSEVLDRGAYNDDIGIYAGRKKQHT